MNDKPKTPAAPANKGIKILGTKESPVVKTFDIINCKVTEENGIVVVRGYANTKGHPDRYNDIPTVFPSIRNYVYELSEFSKNPVMLLDHSNSMKDVAGSFPEIEEDEIGLRFKAVFSQSELPEIKHARTVFLEGHARAFSIAGSWHYEDPANKNHLTYAEIYHISPVGVGADPDALGDATLEAPEPKAAPATPALAPAKPVMGPEELKAKLSELVSAVGEGEVKEQLKISIQNLKKMIEAEPKQEE